VHELELGDLGRAGNDVVEQRGGAQLALLVVVVSLVQCAAEPLRDRSMDLPLDDHRVDDPAAVLRDHVSHDLDGASLVVDDDDACVGRVWIHGLGRVEQGAEPISLRGCRHQLRDRYGGARRADHAHRAVGDLQVCLRRLQPLPGVVHQPLADGRARRADRAPGGDGTA
jgi:hypothetical protein